MLIGVDEVMELLNCTKSMAYRQIRDLNKMLKEQGYLTLVGKVEESYLKEKFRLEVRNDD